MQNGRETDFMLYKTLLSRLCKLIFSLLQLAVK